LREKEIREFVPKPSFKLEGIFLNDGKQEIAAKLKKISKKNLKPKNSWNNQKLQNSKF
jgi:DNA topoisomerase-1